MRMRLARSPQAAAALVIAVIGAVYAFAVPFGLPYDEPSHWQNVVHIAETANLPRVGEAGTSYEAVQAPLAYVVDALVLAPLDDLGLSDETAFRTVRVVNVGWLVAFLIVLTSILRRLAPSVETGRATAAAAVVAGSPIIVAIGSSVQNDLPAIVLAASALLIFDDVATTGGPKRAALLGLVLGLAFLAKASVWPLGLVLVGGLFLRGRRRDAGVAVVIGLVVSGWWVVRNFALYGSATGNNAVEASGTDFPPIGFNGVGTLVDLARSTVTFLWIPVEYWRNAVTSPSWVEVLVAGSVVVTVTTAVAAATRKSSSVSALRIVTIVVAVVGVAVWAATTVFLANASFRLAYIGLPAWAWAVLTTMRMRAWAPWAFGATCAALHAFSIAGVMSL